MIVFVYLSLSITEYNSLSDSEGIIKITQGIKLPFLPFNGNKKLFDAMSLCGETIASISI